LHSLLSLLMQIIDFNKLDTVALKRYRRIHKLDDVGSNPTKEELVSAVGKHFTAQVCGSALMGLSCIMPFMFLSSQHFGCCVACVKGKCTACRNILHFTVVSSEHFGCWVACGTGKCTA